MGEMKFAVDALLFRMSLLCLLPLIIVYLGLTLYSSGRTQDFFQFCDIVFEWKDTAKWLTVPL